jgi:hypothetical protein
MMPVVLILRPSECIPWLTVCSIPYDRKVYIADGTALRSKDTMMPAKKRVDKENTRTCSTSCENGHVKMDRVSLSVEDTPVLILRSVICATFEQSGPMSETFVA